MRMYDLIMKKRNGGVLSEEEIRTLIDRYTKGEIPDYQMSAFCMAVYFQDGRGDRCFNRCDGMFWRPDGFVRNPGCEGR